MWFLGIVIGFILGAIALHGYEGGLAGGLVGLIIALAIRSRAQTIERQAMPQRPAGVATHPPSSGGAGGGMDTLASTITARLASMEQRLGRIEAQLGGSFANTGALTPAQDAHASSEARTAEPGAPPASVPVSAARAAQFDVPVMPPAETPHLPEGWVQGSDGTLQPQASDAALTSLQDAEASLMPAPDAAHVALSAATGGAFPPPTPPAAPNPLWAWFTGGNALTRIGVVVLFFGVGFLLKYFAHYITIPIELRLSGVALLGAVLIALGIKLQANRPGYGLSLQGAGAGILYLTVFAAFRFYDVLPATVAFVLLAATAGLTVWLAIRNDSQPLAGLAIAGGFLAPFLVDSHGGAPALLFGYFAVLNAAIFAVAGCVRRALGVLGFLFTFALGLIWGRQYYIPEQFATVEPFLILFFAFLCGDRGALREEGPAGDACARRRAAGVHACRGRLCAAGRAGARHPLRGGVERLWHWRRVWRAVRHFAQAIRAGIRVTFTDIPRARDHFRHDRDLVCRRPSLDFRVVGARSGGRILGRL
jgi:uncharacterized membrane protein